MKMRFLRIEKWFDSDDYIAVFDCEDVIGVKYRKWQIQYSRQQIEHMLKHPQFRSEAQRAIEALDILRSRSISSQSD